MIPYKPTKTIAMPPSAAPIPTTLLAAPVWLGVAAAPVPLAVAVELIELVVGKGELSGSIVVPLAAVLSTPTILELPKLVPSLARASANTKGTYVEFVQLVSNPFFCTSANVSNPL
jgi:hypothetical protein